MDCKNIFFKFANNQFLLIRKYILLVDNTFNNEAELTDNFALFEWLQTQSKYKKISYYIINKHNVQYKQIATKYPHNIIPVEHGMLDWPLLRKMVRAKFWLDSFQVISAFDPDAIIRKGKITTVYTQHGINYFKPGFLGNIAISPKYFNKIIFSNTTERELFKKYYGYNDKNAVIAGLSRWDLMKKHPQEKIIFAYFTSRAYLNQGRRAQLTQSKYYKNIIAFLSSRKMKEFLQKNNIKLYVGMHHEMTKCKQIKKQMLSEVNLIEDKDIGNIKQKASMLITDFSSMCFDFMIKDKPVIFFRVDAGDSLCKLHPDSAENDINVEKKNNELYNIFYTAEDVVDSIEKYVKNNFQLEKEYIAKNEKFFTYRENIRQHLIENLLSSPKNVSNVLPGIKMNSSGVRYCLLNFLPFCEYKRIGGRKQWKIFGFPIFKIRRMANGITTKYYVLGFPIMKVSRKLW